MSNFVQISTDVLKTCPVKLSGCVSGCSPRAVPAIPAVVGVCVVVVGAAVVLTVVVAVGNVVVVSGAVVVSP